MARTRRHNALLRNVLSALLILQMVDCDAFADKVANTPSIIQNAFGPNGSDLPNDGNQYCGPTTFTEQLFYFNSLGWSRLVGNATPETSLGLVELMGGLMNTTAGGGTTGEEFSQGVTTYFRAKGIGAADFNISSTTIPTLQDLTDLNSPNTSAVALALHFYSASGESEGGHFVALAATNPGVNTMTILNPHAPQPVGNGAENPQVINLLSFTAPNLGAIPVGTYLQIDPSQIGTYRTGQTALILDARAISLAGSPTAPMVDWQLAGMQSIHTGTQTLDIITTVSGTGGLSLTSAGTLLLSNTFTNAYAYSGGTQVEAGQVISKSSVGTPFGTGDLQLSSGGSLLVQPAGSGQVVDLLGATQSGTALSVDGGRILLDRGLNTSLTFTVGSHTSGATPNLQIATGAYLTIANRDGIENLGVTETLRLAGNSANLPPLVNGIVQAFIVGTTMGSAELAGDFLTYDDGFKKGTYTPATATPIANTTSNTIYEVDVHQSVSGTSEVYVVKVNSGNAIISGGAGSQLIVAGGGLILNGGTVSVDTLQLGAAQGSIYTGAQGGEISSSISGSNGLTVFGPGNLILSGDSIYTGTTRIFGNLTVNGALGSTSDSVAVEKGAELSGSGLIRGSTSIIGALVPGDDHAGLLSFGGSLDFQMGSIYAWELNAATDDNARAGVDWDLLSVDGDIRFDGNARLSALLTLSFGPGVGDPDSGLAFWDEDRKWLIAESQNGSITGTEFFLPFAPGYNDGAFSITNSMDGTQLYLNYKIYPVPEPNTTGLLLIGFSAYLLRRNARSRSLP